MKASWIKTVEQCHNNLQLNYTYTVQGHEEKGKGLARRLLHINGYAQKKMEELTPTSKGEFM